MTPEAYEKAQQIFLELRELNLEERAIRISVLELDLDVREALELAKHLLNADDEVDDFLEPPNQSHEAPTADRPNEFTTQTQSILNKTGFDQPKRIGPYRILQKIGEGGHGVVYMAEQTTPVRRRVALKWIKPGMESKQILARFDAERQALALMNHPSIANVFDADTSETGQPYFVMELVHGVSIDQFCCDNKLSLSERIELFKQVCDAVHHAHQKGVIHRDIKPGNVLVTVESGKPLAKVIDFGIAKAMHSPLTDQTMFTQYGQIIGTLEYMSPEQAVMSHKGADVRSDVYSLGVLLYVLLTGTTPISKQELLKEGIWEFKNVLRDFRPQTPSLRLTDQNDAHRWRDHAGTDWLRELKGDLDWITMKALAKEPDLRYDSPAALIADLDNFVSGDPVLARPPSRWYRLSKFIQRNRVTATVATTILLSMLASILALSYGYVASQRNVVKLRSANSEAKRQRDIATAQAQQMAITSRQTLLESAWKLVANGEAKASNEQLNDVPLEHRNFAWNFVQSVAKQTDWTSLGSEDAGAVRVVSFDQRNRQMAVIRTDSTLEIWSFASGKLSEKVKLPHQIYTVASFSTDGRTVLLGCSSQSIRLVDLESKRLSKASASINLGAIRDAIHDTANHRWLVTTGGNYVVDINDQTLKANKQIKLPSRIGKIIMSPNGQQLAISSNAGQLFLLDADDIRSLGVVEGADGPLADWRWTNDGISLVTENGTQYTLPNSAISSDGTSAKQLSLTADESKVILNDERLGPTESTFVMASHSDDATQFDLLAGDRSGMIRLHRTTTGSSIPLRQFGSPVETMHFDHDTGSAFVIHRNGRINVIDGDDIACRRTYVEGLQDVSDGACLANSFRSITTHTDGFVKVWNTQTGNRIRERRIHQGEIFSIAVHEASGLAATFGSDFQLNLFHVDSLNEKRSQALAYGVRSVRFSTNGKMLACAPAKNTPNTVEGTIEIQDVVTGKPRQFLRGHTNWVVHTEFFDEDRKLVSQSVDGTARVWSTATGQHLVAIDLSRASTVRAMTVVNDDQLAFGHADGSISLWDAATGELLCSRSLFGDEVVGLVSVDGADCLIASAANDSRLSFISNKTLKTIGRFEVGIGLIKNMQTDLTDRKLQIFGSFGAVRIWDLPFTESPATQIQTETLQHEPTKK